MSWVGLLVCLLMVVGLGVGTSADEEPAPGLLDSFGQLVESVYQIQDVTSQTEGRGRKGGKGILPLIIGYKVASAVVAAISVVKVLVLKAVVISGLAVLVSLAVSLKTLLEKLKKPTHHQVVPYHHSASSPTHHEAVPYHHIPSPPLPHHHHEMHEDLPPSLSPLSGYASDELFQQPSGADNALSGGFDFTPSQPIRRKSLLGTSPSDAKTDHKTIWNN